MQRPGLRAMSSRWPHHTTVKDMKELGGCCFCVLPGGHTSVLPYTAGVIARHLATSGRPVAQAATAGRPVLLCSDWGLCKGPCCHLLGVQQPLLQVPASEPVRASAPQLSLLGWPQ